MNTMNTLGTCGLFSATQDARIACERAVAELRYGRPVIYVSGPQDYAVLSLDTATEETVKNFSEAANGHDELFVSAERAAVLGIDADSSAMFVAKGLSLQQLSELAYGRFSSCPPIFNPAPAPLNALSLLAGLALLLPAFLCFAVDRSDPKTAGCAVLSSGDLSCAPDAETDFSIVARTSVPLKDVENAEFVVFRGGLAQRDQVAIIVGSPDLTGPVPVRIHSSCITGDLFGSLKCDCGDQLREGIRLIQQRGGGILLYLDQEGRGTGLAAKMRAYGYQSQGLDTIDADAFLGFGQDGRRYGAAVAMLNILGAKSIDLMTNNPRKIEALQKAGLSVRQRTPVLGAVTPENRRYLTTKANRSGHLFDLKELDLSA
jgi:GTP cyclohydrolase II